MSSERHQRVMHLFRSAVVLEQAAQRVFLEEACGGDSALKAEVESMLEYDAAEDDPFSDSRAPLGPQLLDLAVSETASEEKTTPRLPARIGQYRPLRIIGQGGMGIVYEAQQDAPRRTVALKMIRGAALSGRHLRRLRLEAELLGRLKHPGIAQIYEAGTLTIGGRDLPFFAMELIEGTPITEYASERRLDIRGRLELFVQVCDAVQHAHQKGVVHRDLKPDNILVDVRGQARVLDFGVARATDSDVQVTTIQTDVGTLIGTVPYMSPEQIAGQVDDVDTRSDVYALGVILFELLSGRLPHDINGRSIIEAARIIREDDPTRLGSVATMCRGDLDIIVGKALEKEPPRRYQSAADLAKDVRSFLASEPISARPPTTIYQLRRFARRNRPLVGGVAIAFIALAVGLSLAIRFGLSARARAEEADWANYKAQIARASSSLRSQNAVTGYEAIEAAPKGLRNWEWRYLHRRLTPAISSYSAADNARIHDLTWSAEGAPILVESIGNSTRVVDGRTGRVINSRSFPGPIDLAAVSRGGRRIASCDNSNRIIYVWDTEGQSLWTVEMKSFTYQGAERPISHIDEISLDDSGGRMGCAGSTPDGGFICALDVETGTHRFNMPFGTLAGSRHTAISHNGRFLIDHGYGIIFGISLDSGQGFESPNLLDYPSGFAWSPDDQLILAWSSQRRSVAAYRPGTSEVALRAFSLRSPPTGRVGISHDAKQIAICRKDVTELRSLESNQHVTEFRGNAEFVAFSPDDQFLFTADRQSARIIPLSDIDVPSFADTSSLYLAAFSPDGSLLATGGFSGEVRLWDTLEGDPVGRLKTRTEIINALCFGEDGDSIFTATRKNREKPPFDSNGIASDACQLWDLTTLNSREDDKTHAWIDRMAPGSCAVVSYGGVGFRMSFDGSLYVNCMSVDGTVFDARTGKPILTMSRGSEAIAISSKNHLIATDAPEGVQLWNARSGEPLRLMRLPNDEHVYGVVFSNDDTRLVAAGRSGWIYFLDVATGELVCSFELHKSFVHCVAFSRDGTRLATASGDGTARLLDIVPNEQRELERAAARTRRGTTRSAIVKWQAEGTSVDDILARIRRTTSLTAADRRVLGAEVLSLSDSNTNMNTTHSAAPAGWASNDVR